MSVISDSNVGVMADLYQYIRYFKGKAITYYKGYMDADMEIHVADIFDNFWNENNYDTVTLTEAQVLQYQYNPKGLSQLLYGTPDMWWVLLKVNGFEHPGQLVFNNRKLKVPDATALDSYLSKVYNMKEDALANNQRLW